MKIYKCSLMNKFNELDEKISLTLPVGAKILNVMEQHNNAFIWVLFDTCNLDCLTVRNFEIIQTGKEFDASNRVYVGNLNFNGGNYIFHVFEKLSEKGN